ncbi:MAG: hemerythrin [Hirschia sp.]|nr:hemerythrin [Hirschia sp.]MBF18756.1 hemerythrin [Hirschia sp.]MBF18951.1 hemerythrin [Hirschia sp.]|tara:strand:+ start:333 stop:806 length:474 start_codon:yes stop_codon:yes gene_type:complete
MEIYTALKNDHDKHRDLLAKIDETSGDSERRRELWGEFYCSVKSHAAAEEETFYAALMKDADGQPKARHSVAEHKELDDLIDELNDMDMSSSGWLNRFKTLRHDYEHHIDEEEEDIFPVAEDVFSHEKAEQLGQRFEKREKAELSLVAEKSESKLVD